MTNFMGGPGCDPDELLAAEFETKRAAYKAHWLVKDTEAFRKFCFDNSNAISALLAKATAKPQGCTPLMEMFGAIAVPLCKHPNSVQLRVWFDHDDGWHASWGTGGSVGGRGATPEDAILQAHENYIRLRDRNGLKARVAAVKKRRRK